MCIPDCMTAEEIMLVTLEDKQLGMVPYYLLCGYKGWSAEGAEALLVIQGVNCNH